MVDNELISPEESGNLGETGTKFENNGAFRVEEVNCQLLEEINVPATAVVSPSVTVVVSVDDTRSPFSAANKRQGLKKWKRIPRELAKKAGRNLKPRENGDFTVRKGMVNDFGNPPVQPGFATSADSEGSSWSSTASDSRIRDEISSLNGENSVLVDDLPDDHRRNGRIGPGKKARGVKMEKENSDFGIMGSDFRRSNFVFVQGGETVASKGRQSGTFAEPDGESSDDLHLNEEAEITFVKTDAESDDVSLPTDDTGDGKHEGSMEHDALVGSIKDFLFAREEFEKEVQKWRDVGKDDPLIFNDPIQEILELKDAKILKLESALSSGGVESELEDCLMKVIQANVEYVVITTTTRRLTEGPLREIKHNLHQKIVSSQDLQPTKKQDGNLETKESLKNLQNRVCRFSLCFMIQFMLLLVTLYLEFSPQYVEVVPT
ncbi:hypothetical protein SSX86_005974 [Deinandra increscens subsp. villosa]|uniref:Uncharacterized protein n=1 Tax=Deinandra increscens subsp. villosa TaxID=3103831 RepID=A0AAP0HAJ9_9ASTR